MIIKLLIDGGEMKPSPAVAQQLGPMGVNMGKVISEVNEATKSFKGMKVPVQLDINEKTKDFTISTSSPPTAELLKKELKIEKGTADHKKIKVGNASIEDVIKVAKMKHSNMLEKEFKSAVKSVLGTCKSIGILVENKSPKELTLEINSGKFDKEINEKIEQTNPEKRKNLNDFFKGIKSEQDAIVAAEQKATEEAKKEEESASKEKAKTEKKP